MATQVHKTKAAASTSSTQSAASTGSKSKRTLSAKKPSSVAPVIAATLGSQPVQGLPPSSANIPTVPADFEPGTPGEYRPFLPRSNELTALPRAVIDMTGFTTYAQTLGSTAPAYTQVMNAFTLASAWSSMRTASYAWDSYAAVQEGMAWKTLRALLERLQPAFELAIGGEPALQSSLPGLSLLLGARKVIGQKAAATRTANKKAEAAGKPATHGAVGKKRKTAAEKAAYALQNAASSAAPAPVQPAAPVVAPVVTGAATPAATATH